MAREISALEVIRTQRAIRRFSDDPVPDEAIATIIEAATRAPSPGNRQSWHFLVIRDQEIKRRIGEYYWQATVETRGAAASAQQASSPVHRAADELAQHIGEVPLPILVCVDARPPGPTSRGNTHPWRRHLSGYTEPDAGSPEPGAGHLPHHPIPLL